MKHILLILSFMFLIALSGNSSIASQEPEDVNNLVNLEDYLEFTALNNAGLKAAFEQWKAAVEKIPQAKALPDPKFTYGYFIKEVETKTGPQRQKLSLMQTFPWFGVIEAGTDAASSEAKAAYKKYESTKLDLFFKVKYSFYEYAYLGRAIEIARQNLELLRHFEEVARTRYTTSAGSHPDIIRSQIELAFIEDKLKSLEELQAPIVTSLNSILNRKTDLSLPWPARKQFNPVKIDREAIIAELIENNPQLQALDFEVIAAKARIEIAKRKSYPNLNIGLDWIQTDDAQASGIRDNGKDPIIAMFSINLPIWTDSYKAAELETRAKMRSISAKKIQSRNDLIAKLEKTLYEFEDALRKIDLYEDVLIPKAKEMLEASEVAYKAGTVDFLSLIDAQRSLLEFELSYERAITENLQKAAEIEMLTGN